MCEFVSEYFILFTNLTVQIIQEIFQLLPRIIYIILELYTKEYIKQNSVRPDVFFLKREKKILFFLIFFSNFLFLIFTDI